MKQRQLFPTRLLLSLITLLCSTGAWAEDLSGSGTKTDPYLIQSDTDWETFAGWINGESPNTYNSKYYKLAADINVSTPAGSNTSNNYFRGTFDGNGHTMTLNLTSTSDYCAPFRYVKSCTIKRLHVTGTITTTSSSTMNAGGIVGEAYEGTINIYNCWSSVTINSSRNGNGNHGGFIGRIHWYGGSVYITNCLFDGKLLGSSTTNCGGFVGQNASNTERLNITNCIFAPTEVTIGTSGSYTFSYTKNQIVNSYYTEAFGTEQGTAVGTMTNEDILDAFGSGWEIKSNKVVPVLDIMNIAGGSLECKSFFSYTGSEINVAPTVRDMDGSVLDASNYVVTFSPSPVQSVGDYTMTVTGNANNGYSGELKHKFFVDVAPQNMYIDRDFQADELGYYYVNMPVGSETNLDLSTDNFTKPFKVYDNGGKNGNYPSDYNRGRLLITAPEGYVIQLTGSVKTKDSKDYLQVYEEKDNLNSYGVYQLGKYKIGSPDGEDVGELISTGNHMYIIFYAWTGNGEGLDLTVTLLSKAETHSITVNSATGGSVLASPSPAGISSTVTLTATPKTGYLPADFTVVDANQHAVTVEGGWYTGNEATFVMPPRDVTVTPVFTNNLTAEGGLYVNMLPYFVYPTNAKRVNIPDGVSSFKIYDCAGKDASILYCHETYMLLTAPEGRVLEITGAVNCYETNQELILYDGSTNDDDKKLTTKISGSNMDIGMYTSSANQVLVYFKGQNSAADIDLMVRVIDPSDTYSYTVATADYGSLTPATGTAAVNEVVNLTVNPDDNYLVSELVMKDASNHDVQFTGGLWYSGNPTTASFKMPANNVTVTPTFAKNDELAINMPNSSHNQLSIAFQVVVPDEVTSFKIYDDGGPDGNYSTDYWTYMVLTAPTGCTIHVTGSVKTYNSNDYLRIYDGSKFESQYMFGAYSGTKDIDVTSTGNQMLIYFWSDESNVQDGFELTATIISDFNVIVAEAEHGSAVASPTSASYNKEITVTATPEAGYFANEFVVADNKGNTFFASGGWYSNNVSTFRMPGYSDVTVTPSFIDTPTAEGGLFVTMPKTSTVESPKTVTIPVGVTTFKVYDDGGKDANYSNGCDGYLLLKAPEGSKLQLTGKVNCSDTRWTWLTVYDGNSTASYLGNAKYGLYSDDGEDIGTLTSTSNQMLLYFKSDMNSNVYSGLNLTVETLPTSIDIKMNQYGIMTYASPYALDFGNVTVGGVASDGLTAFYASAFTASTNNDDTGTLTLTQAGEVPAGEGLLLKGTKNETYTVPVIASAEALDPANLLVGLTTPTEVYQTQTIGEDEYTSFILANGNSGINWYVLAEDSYVLKANSAYLRLKSTDVYGPNGARQIVMNYDEASGISDVVRDMRSSDDSWYTVDGVKLGQKPTRKGLYIVNGKVVVIK